MQSVQTLPTSDPLSSAAADVAEAGEAPLLLVRHGRTAANAQKLFVGTLDVPLDDEGHRQAALAARRLRALPRAALYSSPLARAMQTAAPLGTPELVGTLKELHQGEFEGQPAMEVVPAHPEIFHAWAQDPTDVRVPGGETLRELAQRVMPTLEELGRRHGPGPPIVVVTHQMVLAVAVLSALGLPFRFLRHVRQPNTALTLMGWSERGFRVHRLNDHAHLEDSFDTVGA